ncbi:MAG TPA: FUSC family protein [Acetobacteraceae bacterium]|nr:FUSC family protein [Acetobacteraceae bacterium]
MPATLWEDIAQSCAFAGGAVREAFVGFAQSCAAMRLQGPIARSATVVAIAVVLAAVAASAVHVENVWWVVIGAFMSMRSPRPAALKLGLLRIAGTVGGAALALLLMDWIAYDMAACYLVLFAVVCVGILGFNLSRYALAWLFVSITFNLVVLSSLDDPSITLTLAADRIGEFVVGTSIAVGVAFMFASADPAPPPTVSRGWSGLLTTDIQITRHAIRSGLAVMVIPILWSWFALPGASTTAITVVGIMAAPVLADPRETHAQALVKGLQRIVGCLIGGIYGLFALGFNLDTMLPWLLGLAAGTWVFAYVQSDATRVPDVGTQAAIVMIMTFVQGTGPPSSVIPGITRLAGIFLGLVILFIITTLIGPPRARAAQATAH